MGKRRLGLETGSSSSSSLAPAVACSGGLPSKVRDGVAQGGFSGSPCLVSSACAALKRHGSGEVLGAVAVDGENRL
jgi:hypothetical protein